MNGKEKRAGSAGRWLFEKLVFKDIQEASADDRAEVLKDYYRRTAMMHAFYEGLPELFLQSS